MPSGKLVFAFSIGMFGTAAALDAYNVYYRVNIDLKDPKRPLGRYRIAHDRIGRPGALLHRSPDVVTLTYSPFYPRNGAIVEAVEDFMYPEWLQLKSGKWIMKESCGVQLSLPMDDLDNMAAQNPDLAVTAASPIDVYAGTRHAWSPNTKGR